MRLALVLLALVWLLQPAQASAHPPTDRDEVLASIDRWDRAWQIKDPVLGAQDYSDDAHWVNAFGMQREGRKAIEQTLRQVFALPFVAAGESETKGHSVRFLGNGVALVATQVERKGQRTPSGEDLGTRHTSHLRVLEKRDAKWVIVAHLISDARATGRPAH